MNSRNGCGAPWGRPARPSAELFDGAPTTALRVGSNITLTLTKSDAMYGVHAYQGRIKASVAQLRIGEDDAHDLPLAAHR